MTDTNQEVRETPEAHSIPCDVHSYAQEYEFRFDDGGGYTPTDAERSMIEDAIHGYLSDAASAPPLAVSDAVGVRATRLNWRSLLDETFIAETVLGIYRIEDDGELFTDDRFRLFLAPNVNKAQKHSSLASAKTAAQADFDRRILSCIEPTPSPEPQASNAGAVEALRELLAACEEDCGVPSDGDEDDEAVGASEEGPMALTFGMLRRARAALTTPEPQTGERDGKVVAWFTTWTFHWPTDYEVKHPGGGSSLTTDADGARAKAANIGQWDRVATWSQAPLVRQSALLAERTKTAAAYAEADHHKAALEKAEGYLRMVVSHATAGKTDGVGMGVNDICVAITALRNDLWLEARKKPEQALIEAERRLAEVEERAREDERDRLLDAAQDDMLWGGGLALNASDAFSWLLKKGAVGRVERVSRRAALRAKPEAQAIVGKESDHG